MNYVLVKVITMYVVISNIAISELHQHSACKHLWFCHTKYDSIHPLVILVFQE